MISVFSSLCTKINLTFNSIFHELFEVPSYTSQRDKILRLLTIADKLRPVLGLWKEGGMIAGLPSNLACPLASP